jgi:anhydro-N-acetylmuramic acid kinase
LAFETIDYDVVLREKILSLCKVSSLHETREICRANVDIGHAFGNAINRVLKSNNIKDVDLIGSHGQTIWHEIEESNNNRAHSTLQIGCAATIAKITGITTIANFRTADIANGGQGGKRF